MALKFKHKNALFNFLKYEEPEFSEELRMLLFYKGYPLLTAGEFLNDLRHLEQNFINELMENKFQKDFPTYCADLTNQLKEIQEEITDGIESIQDLVAFFVTEDTQADRKTHFKFPDYLIAFVLMTAHAVQTIEKLLRRIPHFSNKNIPPVDHTTQKEMRDSPKMQIRKIFFKITHDEALSFFWLFIKAEKIKYVDEDTLKKFLTVHFLFSDNNSEAKTYCMHEEDSIEKLIFKMTKTSVFAFFKFLRDANIIEHMTDDTLGASIALHFDSWEKNKSKKILSGSVQIEFSRCNPKDFYNRHLTQVQRKLGDLIDRADNESEKNRWRACSDVLLKFETPSYIKEKHHKHSSNFS